MESRNYQPISLLPVATNHRLSNTTDEPPIGQIPAPLSVDAGQLSGSAGRRLLVVDDNVDLALTTAMLLRIKQYETHARFSGADALADVEQLQPDVILLDLGMPDMDGFETAARLRALPWGQHGFIVALTGYGQPEDRQRTRDAGFDGHLVKPFNMTGLITLLTQLLGSRD
jgi:CheY-like chemotaxis protein